MIPLGGIGSRFQKEGYKYPKPFVKVLGKEMILWVVDSLALAPEDTLVVVYNPAFLAGRKPKVRRGFDVRPASTTIPRRASRGGLQLPSKNEQHRPRYEYLGRA